MDTKFWNLVDTGNIGECWKYLASPSQRYGKYSKKIDGKWKLLGAHRYAWEQYFGEIPEGLFVCHHCDNPFCCNPYHLFIGTGSDNQLDSVRKGRDAKYNIVPQLGEKHHSAKLTEEQVIELRERYATGGVTQFQLADEYGIAQQNISKAILRKSWKNI